jgi:hypothetical protein
MTKLTLLSLIFFHFFIPSLQAQNAPKPLLNAIQDYVAKQNRLYGGKGRNFPKFRHILIDLNKDSSNDAIVLLQDGSWCGTGGCPMLIFKGNKEGFAFISQSDLTKPPVRVLSERSQGWRTLIVHAGKRGDVVLRFDGAGYPSGWDDAVRRANQYQINSAQILLDRSKIIY